MKIWFNEGRRSSEGYEGNAWRVEISQFDSLASEDCYSMKVQKIVHEEKQLCKGGCRSIKNIIKNNYCYISSIYEVSSIMLSCINIEDPKLKGVRIKIQDCSFVVLYRFV